MLYTVFVAHDIIRAKVSGRKNADVRSGAGRRFLQKTIIRLSSLGKLFLIRDFSVRFNSAVIKSYGKLNDYSQFRITIPMGVQSEFIARFVCILSVRTIYIRFGFISNFIRWKQIKGY